MIKEKYESMRAYKRAKRQLWNSLFNRKLTFWQALKVGLKARKITF